LCRHIVDLVQTGATLKANGLVEIEHIADVSSRLIVNRPALKTRPEEVGRWIERFRAVADGTGHGRPRVAASV
jgi:ATP phosphoribosyltransferase